MSEPLNSQSEASNESVAESVADVVAEVVATPTDEAMVPSLCDYEHPFESMSLESSCLSCPPLQDADGQACLDAPPEEPKLEEPKLEVCEMPCQKQLAVESVEMSVESSLSGHVVPEVTIEG